MWTLVSSSRKTDIDVIAKNLHRSQEVVKTCKYKPISVCNLLIIQKTPGTRIYNIYVHIFFWYMHSIYTYAFTEYA